MLSFCKNATIEPAFHLELKFMRDTLPHRAPVLTGLLRLSVVAPLALLLGTLCWAQTTTPRKPATPAPPAVSNQLKLHHKKVIAAKPPLQPTPAEALPPTPTLPPAPPPPLWPANERPNPAVVTWNSQGLRIDADNSSLAQILDDVAASIGATVEGASADQRIFGAYGPGKANVVLAQLLQGSGYNILMVGDQGQGTPRQIILTARHSGASTPASTPVPSNSDEDADVEEQPQPQPQPASNIRPVPNFPPQRNPQQFMQRPQPMQPIQLGQPQSGASPN
jgi:hypothetical protein